MKDKRKREGIEMIAINARTSPIELKEPGKLRLVSEENNNKPRPKKSIKEKGSKNLEKVLLIKQLPKEIKIENTTKKSNKVN